MVSPAREDVAVGLISGDTLSDEQTAYRARLETLGFDVEDVQLHEDAELGCFDVLCWHRGQPFDAKPPTDALKRLHEFVGNGGGLFLSLFALKTVERMGIDDQTPDATPERTPAESGLLTRELYAEHPLFEPFSDLRLRTQPGREGISGVCYRRFLPQDGAVLAGRISGGDDAPHEKPLCEWQVGTGTVLGLGTDFWMEASTGSPYDRAIGKLLASAVSHLADPTGRGEDYPAGREDFETMRTHLASDPHRPSYHLTPPANWINDPNGIIKWNGHYHVFYQYNPAGPFHDTIHWGHAVSDDLVSWTDRPIALSPDPEGPDRDGCWSGCAVDHDGTPTLLYTGGNGRDQLPCIATGDDDLENWTGHAGNPIIPGPPEDPSVLETEHWRAEFRDHCVWQEGDTWYQIIGSGIEDEGGTAFLYESSDLYAWEYQDPIMTGEWAGAGPVWECPELLDLGEKSLLHVSNYIDVVYFLGEYDDGSFDPEAMGKLDYGDFYAPQSLSTDDRTITWGWLTEARSARDQWDAGWSGALSLPREVDLDEHGDLRIRPVEELEVLRGDHHGTRNLTLTPDSANPLADVQSRACEVALVFDPGDTWEVSLALLQTPAAGSSEQTILRYSDGQVVVEREESACPGEGGDVNRHEQTMPVSPREDGTIQLRCFLDGSVLEVFANEHRCLTSRVYPTSEDSTNMELFVLGGSATVAQLDVWEIDAGGVSMPEENHVEEPVATDTSR